jgi:FkbM family methyltransferase
MLFSLGWKPLYVKMLDCLEINCVIDVGVNNGEFAKNLRSIGYSGYILSFELDPICYAELVKHFAADRYLQGYNLALGSSDTISSLKNNSFSVMNSFLAKNTNNPLKVDAIEFPNL